MRQWTGLLLPILLSGPAMADGKPPRSVVSRDYADAKALFEKLWEPGAPAPAGGDGLGPLFNERSCVGCHHQAGVGGSGENAKNISILTAVPGASIEPGDRPTFRGEPEDLHPGFHNRTSIVLHAHAIADEGRLAQIRDYQFVQTRDELFALHRSPRSTPALFGAGRIDAIPDSAIVSAESRKDPNFPEISGRVSRLRDGRIGRFGWKGQTARLADFVMAACANELGLEVRGRHQPSLLSDAEFDPKRIALDLSDDDCRLLIRFVESLPAPVDRSSRRPTRGPMVFEAIGCAACHTPDLGGVRGLYSDLLLHDLGDRFRSFGGGYDGPPSKIVDSGRDDAGSPTGEASPTEWRTTPLWGVADSAPYLHDGRAATLHEAIILHGGEAKATRNRYEALAMPDRQALLAFLRSQVAPPQRVPRNAKEARELSRGTDPAG